MKVLQIIIILIEIGDTKQLYLKNEHGYLIEKVHLNMQEADIQQVILIEV
jgi:hypothetical protein